MSELTTFEGTVKAVAPSTNGLLFEVDGNKKWYNSKDFKVDIMLKGAVVRLLNVADDKDFESLEIIKNPSKDQQEININRSKQVDGAVQGHYEKIVARFLIGCNIHDFDVFKQNLKQKSEELRKYMRE